ncbi:MAG: response regulator [Burkholderiales bacterium]|jgi:twitching motility two-component system response regulator PilH|nr:response regulator [Burkholderiales bacterium]
MAKILIVDDSPTERHVLEGYLIEAGHQVFQADCGDKGIEEAKKVKPDIILMDVVMPGLNGFQTTRLLKREAETSSIPVLLCTTKNQPTDRVWGLRQGACEYLTKPVSKQALLEKIEASLSGSCATPPPLKKT